MKATGLPRVREAAQKVGIAQDDLDDAKADLYNAIRGAHSAGLSLRQIASVAEMSHEQVRRMISADRS